MVGGQIKTYHINANRMAPLTTYFLVVKGIKNSFSIYFEIVKGNKNLVIKGNKKSKG